MNYAELAATLHYVGEKLSKHAAKIEGESMGRSAQIFSGHLAKFEEVLSDYVAGRKSGEALLETLLRSPAAKRHLTVDLLKRGLREVTAKRLKSDDLRAAKREFFKQVLETNKQQEAAKYLKMAFADAIHLESGGKDKASVQMEFVGLGEMSDEEFSREIGKKSMGELRRLAKTNGIRFTEKTTKQRLAGLIRRYAQRAVFNMSSGA